MTTSVISRQLTAHQNGHSSISSAGQTIKDRYTSLNDQICNQAKDLCNKILAATPEELRSIKQLKTDQEFIKRFKSQIEKHARERLEKKKDSDINKVEAQVKHETNFMGILPEAPLSANYHALIILMKTAHEQSRGSSLLASQLSKFLKSITIINILSACDHDIDVQRAAEAHRIAAEAKRKFD
ncbi:MAG TPA: hypothetical protein VHA13_01645, partial [Gammaproteobacteria bacterium]|nr:hypothetical protein [Gammaproteobacteria bacterium]